MSWGAVWSPYTSWWCDRIYIKLQLTGRSRLILQFKNYSFIIFAKVWIVGIRFSKASCFQWIDVRKYLPLPRRQLYVHVYVNRDQNQWYSSQNPSLFTALKLFFAANIIAAFPPAYVDCFDVYLILSKDPWGFHSQVMFGVFHFKLSSEPSLHRTLFPFSSMRGMKSDMFLGAPFMLLTYNNTIQYFIDISPYGFFSDNNKQIKVKNYTEKIVNLSN